MLTDRKGNDIAIGSVVNLRLIVTNEITGADPVNLLAKPESPWPGVPQDQRWSIASAYVDVVAPAAAPAAPTGPPGFSGILPPKEPWPPASVPAPPAAAPVTS